VGYSDAVYKAQTVLQRLIAMAAQGDIISKQNVSYFVQLAEENQLDKIKVSLRILSALPQEAGR